MDPESQKSKSRFTLVSVGILVLLCVALTLAYLLFPPGTGGGGPSLPRHERVPSLTVSTLVGGLDHPWDLTFRGNTIIFSQRDSGDLWAIPDGKSEARLILPKPADLWVSGETGMMSVLYYADNLYTCSGWIVDGKPEVRVNRWDVSDDLQVSLDGPPVVTGLPATSGRHGGCALEVTREGFLWIGTGDAADEANSQDTTSGVGKVLRVFAKTGTPAPRNPFPDGEGFAPLIYSYGHRNVQGLALDPSGRGMFTAEQGSNIDDEVNVLS